MWMGDEAWERGVFACEAGTNVYGWMKMRQDFSHN